MGRKKYDKYSDDHMIKSWMKDYSNPGGSLPKARIPSFDNLWTQAFREKRIEPELIEKAMLPMRVAGIFAGVFSILVLVVFFITNKKALFGIKNQVDNIGQAGKSLLSPIINVFNSSVFVSIPLSIVFGSILLYFIFSIINSLNKSLLGSA